MCAFNSSGMIHAYFQKTVHLHTNQYKHMVITPLSSSSIEGSNKELAYSKNG
jgi:hypothetical protein